MKTTSYEISKKLEEAGFEADADYYWVEREERIVCVNAYVFSNYMIEGKKLCEAYDLETLLVAFPEETEIRISNLTKGRIFYLDSWWKNIRGNEASIAIEENESFADTAGKMWLMLKERGIIC